MVFDCKECAIQQHKKRQYFAKTKETMFKNWQENGCAAVKNFSLKPLFSFLHSCNANWSYLLSANLKWGQYTTSNIARNAKHSKPLRKILV